MLCELSESIICEVNDIHRNWYDLNLDDFI